MANYCLDCATPTPKPLCPECAKHANKIGSAQERIKQLRAEGDPR